MATIIEALVVRLGLDSSDLDKKSTSAGRKLKDLESAGGKAEGSVKKLGKSSKEASSGVSELGTALKTISVAVGAATAAFAAFADSMINSGAAIDRLSKNLNVSAGDITAWSNAAEELGGSAKGVQAAMQTVSKAQTDIQLTGNSSLIPYLNMLNVSLADTSGHALKSTDILMELAGAAEGKDRRTMANVFASMGFDESTINLLLQGRKELELTMKRQKEYADQAAKFAPEATKMQRSIVYIKQQFTLLGLNLVQQAAPAIEKILGVISSLGNWFTKNKEVVMDFAKIFAIGMGIVAISVAAVEIAASPLLSVIVPIVLGIAAISAAIALLWQDYQTWQRGGKSLIDWGKWQPGILAAEAAIKNLAKVAKESFGAIFDSANGVWKLIHGDVKGAKAALDKSDDKVRAAVGTVIAAVHQESGILHDPKSKLRGAKAPSAVKSQQVTNSTASGGLSIADQAKALAFRVSRETGISPDVIYAQFRHETGNFKNRGARELNNLSGVNVPGGHGQDYRKFKSLDDYGDYYISLLKRKYKGTLGAKDVNTFAKGLKDGGYFTDSLQNYEHGMSAFYKQGAIGGIPGASRTLSGIPGASSMVASAGNPASSSMTTNHHDNGITIHGDVKVQTQATDGPGVVRAFRDGMNGLLTGQAAAGLS